MVTGEDCSCADTTEPSNLTSLRSDDATSAINSDVNAVCTETVDKRTDTVENPKETDCKCSDASLVETYCIAAPADIPSTVPGRPDRQSLRKKSRSQPPATQSSFPCLYHSHKINGYVLPVKLREDKPQSRPFWNRWKRSRNGKKDKMYEIKLKQVQCPHYAKRVNGAPKQHIVLQPPHEFQPCISHKELSDGISSKNAKHEPVKPKPPPTKTKLKREEIAEKIEIYYFDHGNSAYYRTTDCHPVLITDKCAEKTDQAATRFWAEIFGTIHIGIAFVTAFILQLLRFVLYSVIRPLTVGILQLIADYLIKPLLSILFNALVQPILILLYNIATSLRDLCEPIAEAMGLFLREIANVCAAIRIVEVKHVHAPTTAST
ncbi:hypothetical protein ALC56_02969 [Trachymyrmex septentrionalis]|uniref:Uncharacterized protein n=1 Tax=Trachymyrmex septentrionalis TaxID=34720 RepID=A0A195FRU7_9HYME|nr:PREDICTED: uncharacterized protein LOC108745777 [Trachymyrmex septentrionalis]KYN42634.1 hypothetical protein ALC56_02969 [Trachymyrmex septentrionalis]